MPFNREWSGQTCPHPGRERCCGQGIACVRLQYRKLVAAKARDEVRRSDGIFESLHDLSQESIAYRVTERVVDVLEIVEIKEMDGERAGAAPAGGEGYGEPFQKGAPVRESRQRIRQRENLDPAGVA